MKANDLRHENRKTAEDPRGSFGFTPSKKANGIEITKPGGVKKLKKELEKTKKELAETKRQLDITLSLVESTLGKKALNPPVTVPAVLKTLFSKLKADKKLVTAHVAEDGERAAEITLKWGEGEKLKYYRVSLR